MDLGCVFVLLRDKALLCMGECQSLFFWFAFRKQNYILPAPGPTGYFINRFGVILAVFLVLTCRKPEHQSCSSFYKIFYPRVTITRTYLGGAACAPAKLLNESASAALQYLIIEILLLYYIYICNQVLGFFSVKGLNIYSLVCCGGELQKSFASTRAAPPRHIQVTVAKYLRTPHSHSDKSS